MKFKKKVIKAVVFDVSGVLQLGTPNSKLKQRHLGVHEYLAKKFNLDLDSWFDSIDTPYSNSIEGKISEKQAIKTISKNLNTNQKKLEKIFIKAYKKFFRKNKILYDFAYKLKKKSYVIGILSDQWHLSKKVLTPKKDTKIFNIVIISCDVGLRKPNPEIYKLLIKKVKTKKKEIKNKSHKIKNKEILFIDNREWNLTPAKKLGMKAILFKNNKQFFKEFKKLTKN